jgi:hypothetical protein
MFMLTTPAGWPRRGGVSDGLSLSPECAENRKKKKEEKRKDTKEKTEGLSDEAENEKK